MPPWWWATMRMAGVAVENTGIDDALHCCRSVVRPAKGDPLPVLGAVLIQIIRQRRPRRMQPQGSIKLDDASVEVLKVGVIHAFGGRADRDQGAKKAELFHGAMQFL